MEVTVVLLRSKPKRLDRVSAHLALNYLIDEQLCFALNDLMSNCVLLKKMKELTLSLFSSILAAWMVALCLTITIGN